MLEVMVFESKHYLRLTDTCLLAEIPNPETNIGGTTRFFFLRSFSSSLALTLKLVPPVVACTYEVQVTGYTMVGTGTRYCHTEKPYMGHTHEVRCDL